MLYMFRKYANFASKTIFMIMKKYIFLFLATVVSILTASAQNDVRRLPVRNMTDPAHNNVKYEPMATRSKNRVGSQATAPLRSLGTPSIPVVLVQFDDLHFTLSGTDAGKALASADASKSKEIIADFYDNFCNGRQYRDHKSYGSVYDYFAKQSDSIFQPQFQIIGPVTLSKGYAYYGEGTRDSHMTDFYKEACSIAVNEYNVDWSVFDQNSDGNVDLVVFIFAGQGENGCDDLNTIWPQEGTSSLTVNTETGKITFAAYACVCELFNTSVDGIGLVVHELGHALGLPDFYATNYVAYGMDHWDIMDSGCYQITGKQPCWMTAYELEFMGWRDLVEVKTNEEIELTLEPIETGGKGYMVRNPENPDEYYILENKQNKNWDQYLGWVSTEYYKTFGANHGLFITHIDYDKSAWSSNSVNNNLKHQRVAPVPADKELVSSISTLNGYNDKWAKSMTGDLYPGALDVHDLPYTDASAYTESYTLDGKPVYSIGYSFLNIQESADGIITLTLRRAGYEPSAIDDIHSSAQSGKTYNLQGMEVSNPAPGIYIKNGKKIVVR